MKIVVLTNPTSSSVFIEEQNTERYDYFMGGPDMRRQIRDADLVIAVWPPDEEPIVLRDRTDEHVEIEAVRFHHMGWPTLHKAISSDEWNRD